jgi:predicted alpha/beta-fold hydrolase
MRKAGFRVVVFNPRGVGIPQKTTNLFDYSLILSDFEDFMDHVYQTYPTANVYMTGISLGASLGVKYLGAYKDHSRVKGMVSIANPFNVYKAAASANSWQNIIYGQFLTAKLYEKVEFNKQAIEEFAKDKNIQFDYKSMKNSWTTFEFDKKFTFKVVEGHNDSDIYYQLFSCQNDVENVDVPVLFIHSQNDPISKTDFIPWDVINRKPNFLTVVTPKGAHVEFFVGKNAKRVSL